MQLALTAPLVLAADIEPAMGRRRRHDGIRPRVPRRNFLGEHVETNPAESGRRPAEVGVDDTWARPNDSKT